MAINLQKGQKVDLTKKGDTLDQLHVGLGWDPVSESPKSGGFFKRLVAAPAADVDCDASVIMLGENDKFQNKQDLIYFGNLKSNCGSVIHAGDNITGEGEGDDEVINIWLQKVPANIHKLVFVVNIYDSANRKQHFGMLKNAFIRIVDKAKNAELLRYPLTDDYTGKTSLIVAEIYRKEGEWKFSAVGTGTNDITLKEIVSRYIKK